MKSFLKVFQFELAGLLKGKWFRVSTVIVCLLVTCVMFVPRFLDLGSDSSEENVSSISGSIGIYDPNGVFTDQTMLKLAFPNAELTTKTSLEQMKSEVMEGKLRSAFYISDAQHYEYLIMDSSMNDVTGYILEGIMEYQYQTKLLQDMGLSDQQISQSMMASVNGETTILGTDGKQNYYYTYILIFVLYFVVIFYGQLTATNVASEKGNRAMEILITSTSSDALIFGKVLAGALAGIVQVGVMLGVSMFAYQVNAEAWGNSLDFLFHIPASVLFTFAIFGTLGYLFYSFIYGALGSMVSKVEDVSAAITPIMIIFVISFFVTFMGVMVNPGSMVSTIASYIPFTSCMAMFARVAMGSVDTWQIVLSAAILVISVVLMGFIGAKLYRQGTLSYGNSFKLKHLFQMLKRKD